MSNTQPIFKPTPAQRASMMARISRQPHWVTIEPVRGITNKPIEHRTPNTAYGAVTAEGY